MQWTKVTLDGQEWEVSNEYLYPMGIGEAEKYAADNGYELPTPALVDAIWRAATIKVSPPVRKFVNHQVPDVTKLEHDGSPKTMSSPEVYASQDIRVQELIARAKEGNLIYQETPVLVAGTHKDVVRCPVTGKVGLYGWHSLKGVPIQGLYPHKTPDGKWVQVPFTGHAPSWKDYSQGLRLCRRVPT